MYNNDEHLAHHGIKGMKWGIRRYQNEDGSLTSAGKNRYYGNVRYNKFLTKLPTYNADRRISKDIRRGVRNAAVDTLRGTFSRKSDFTRKDAKKMNRILPGAGTLVRNADTFSKQGFKDSMSRNKQAIKGFGQNASDVYGSEEWRKWKKRRIAKAAVAGTAAALVGTAALGAGISGAVKKSKTKVPEYGSDKANNYINYRKNKDVINQLDAQGYYTGKYHRK